MGAVNGMVRINLKQTRPAYLIPGILFVASAVSSIITIYILDMEGGETVSLGNYLLVFPLFLGILVPARNFPKLMNLGGTRKDFLKSCLPSYAIAAFGTSLICLIIRFLADPIMAYRVPVIYNLFDAFGFMQNGAAIAFIQMGAFLLFTACAAHTLTLLQGRWYGWVVDAALITLLSLVGIAAIGSAWKGFFYMLIFQGPAAAQIVFCVIISVAVYAVGLVPLKSRHIGS